MIGRVALLVTFKKAKPKPQSLSRSHIRDLANIFENMRKLLCALILVVLFYPVFGQEENSSVFQRRNNIQLELGGHGFAYSLNYERIIINRAKYKTTAQLGMSYYPPTIGFRDTWIPICVNELFSFGKHHLEFGLGLVLKYEAGRDIENNPTHWFWSTLAAGRIGYRYQKPDSRFLLRAGFTPFYELDRHLHGDVFHPFGGISIGYAF